MKVLLEEHLPRVYRFALRLTGNRHEADDLTQETFLRAWRDRGRLRDRSAARVWLFAIAANLWRDRLRRRRRERRLARPGDEDPRDPAEAPERQLAVREEVRRVVQALDLLPPRQREVLYLHAWEELSVKEIAEVLGITPEAVKASLSLARRRMRERFQDVARGPRACHVSPSDEQTRM